LSGELVEKLKHRAEIFLREASRLLEEGEYDLSCFNAEQSAQLHLKSLTLKLLGEMPRIHGVRELLGFLARRLHEEGFREEAVLLKEFARENRYELSVLEDAYLDARYAARSFTGKEAKKALSTVLRLIKLLEEVEKRVWMG